MEFHYSTYRVNLKHTFTIARGSEDSCDIVFVYITKDGYTGIGEADPSDRYGESFDQIVELLRNVSFKDIKESDSLDGLLDQVLPKCDGCRSLEAAFDIAIHDLWGRMNNISLTDYFEADPAKAPLTSFTIGIDNLEKIREKVVEAEPYHILKVKLGSDHDKEIIGIIREVTDRVIRVDANEGWNFERALKMCEWLAKRNVEFVEQPLPADRIEEISKLKKQSPLKLIADENCIDSSNILSIVHAFDGINIKLMKCGGLREARKMIDLARKNGLEIMLGCMIESSVAITAAAHLSPLVDYADLDGNILISNDPYDGVKVENGKLRLPSGVGLGVSLR